MKLLYISNQRLPTEKAYGLQICKMCEAFADLGIELELLVPTRRNSITKDLFEYYGIRRNFKTKIIPSLDFYWFGVLDRISFSIKQWIAAIKLIRTARS